jgi:hypothetical protein
MIGIGTPISQRNIERMTCLLLPETAPKLP